MTLYRKTLVFCANCHIYIDEWKYRSSHTNRLNSSSLLRILHFNWIWKENRHLETSFLLCFYIRVTLVLSVINLFVWLCVFVLEHPVAFPPSLCLRFHFHSFSFFNALCEILPFSIAAFPRPFSLFFLPFVPRRLLHLRPFLLFSVWFLEACSWSPNFSSQHCCLRFSFFFSQCCFCLDGLQPSALLMDKNRCCRPDKASKSRDQQRKTSACGTHTHAYTLICIVL